MAYVVLREKKFVFPIEVRIEFFELASQNIFLKELFANPHRDCHRERLISPWRQGNIGFKQAIELEEGLLVKNDVVNLFECDAALSKAISDCMAGSSGLSRRMTATSRVELL